jgi:hypothetical protein
MIQTLSYTGDEVHGRAVEPITDGIEDSAASSGGPPGMMKIQNSYDLLDGSSRRELVWKPRKLNADMSQISRELDAFLIGLHLSSRRDLRYYKAKEGEADHQCPGYHREEIVLGTTSETSLVVFHSTPRPQERCYVCGQPVGVICCSTHPPLLIMSLPFADDPKQT